VQRTAIEAVRFVLRTDPSGKPVQKGRGERGKGERVSAVRSCAEARQPLDQRESARGLVLWSAQERFLTCEVAKSRHHLDRPSRDTWRDPIPSQNR
jgi:hypothetical protein